MNAAVSHRSLRVMVFLFRKSVSKPERDAFISRILELSTVRLLARQTPPHKQIIFP